MGTVAANKREAAQRGNDVSRRRSNLFETLAREISWVSFRARDTTVSAGVFHNTRWSDRPSQAAVSPVQEVVNSPTEVGSNRHHQRAKHIDIVGQKEPQTTLSSELPPPSTITPASAPCGVCCLGDSMTPDTAACC